MMTKAGIPTAHSPAYAQPSSSSPTSSSSPFASSTSPSLPLPVPPSSPTSLLSLLTTAESDLSHYHSVHHQQTTAALHSLQSSLTSLSHRHSHLRADFLFNLSVLSERDADIAELERTRDDLLTALDDAARAQDDVKREVLALRSELKLQHDSARQREEEERATVADLTERYEGKLAMCMDEASALRSNLEAQRARQERLLQQLRDEDERERQRVVRLYDDRMREQAEAHRTEREQWEAQLEHKDLAHAALHNDALILRHEHEEQRAALQRAEEAKAAAEKEVRRMQWELERAAVERSRERQRWQEELAERIRGHEEVVQRWQLQLEERTAVVHRLEAERDDWMAERDLLNAASAAKDQADRARDEERQTEWRSRLDEANAQAEADRRALKSAEHEAALTRQRADVERGVLERTIDELVEERAKEEKAMRRELWRLTEECREREERVERLQREKEERRDELIRVKTLLSEYEEKASAPRPATSSVDDLRQQLQRLAEERDAAVVAVHHERRRAAEVEDEPRPVETHPVHLRVPGGARQRGRPSRVVVSSGRLRGAEEYSPAFSEDLGPASVPSSSPPSPQPSAVERAAEKADQAVIEENAALRAAMKAMEEDVRAMMERWHEERARADSAIHDEREQWTRERERLLDISNRLRAELRRATRASAVEEKEQPAVMDRGRAAVGGSAGEVEKLRLALGGLIEQNRRLSVDFMQGSQAAPTVGEHRPLSSAIVPRSPTAQTHSHSLSSHAPSPQPAHAVAAAANPAPSLATAASAPTTARSARAKRSVVEEAEDDALRLSGRRASLSSRSSSTRSSVTTAAGGHSSPARGGNTSASSHVKRKDLALLVRNYAIAH